MFVYLRTTHHITPEGHYAVKLESTGNRTEHTEQRPGRTGKNYAACDYELATHIGTVHKERHHECTSGE